jgi:serine/threonine-protein kinase
MGVVVAARDVGLDRVVALKLILPQRGVEELQIARFMAEARTASKLQSEHVCKVLEFGRLDDGAPYMVMEMLVGKDLAAVLRERGGLPADEALLYVLQAAHAIAEAHNHGIVHRDLKPANLFLTSGPADEDVVKVLDFGVSKPARGEERMTRTGEMLGSPVYMSPEQIKASRDVDARSDIWSLGCVLFELLAGPGMTPFRGPTQWAIMTQIMMEEPISLATHRPDLPPGLVQVVMHCFGKEPDRRYHSISELVAALAPWVPASAAIYVSRIPTIQFSNVKAERPTAKLPGEPESVDGGTPLPAGAMPAASAPSRGGQGDAASEAPVPTPARPATRRSLAVIMLIAAAALVLVAVGVAIGRARSGPDARLRDVDAKLPGSAASSGSVPSLDPSGGEATAWRAPEPAPEVVPSGAASGIAPGTASAPRGTGKDAPPTRAAPTKPAAPAPPGPPKDRSAFDL